MNAGVLGYSMNLCPEDTIEGWMTKGKQRYKGPVGQSGDRGTTRGVKV